MSEIKQASLKEADGGSWLTILGCGGSLDEWVTGLNEFLAEQGVGTPVAWFQTTGAAVNLYATETKGAQIKPQDKFPSDLTILMAPLDGLDLGRLAIVRLTMSDAKWFDDVIANMETLTR